jgi:hypothetical protein
MSGTQRLNHSVHWRWRPLVLCQFDAIKDAEVYYGLIIAIAQLVAVAG